MKRFLKRHILWVCFTAVIIPLLMILGLQYQSLVKLEKTTPIAQKMWLKNCLWAIATEVRDYYRVNAEQALNIQADLLSPERLQDVGKHFSKHTFDGVKQFFVVTFAKDSEPAVFYYNPTCHAMELQCGMTVSPSINLACTPWKFLSFEETRTTPVSLTVYEQDPENRIILNPILNSSSQVIGVAGIIVDVKFLKQTYIPQTIQKTLPKFFPDETRNNVVVTLRDNTGHAVMSTVAVMGKEPEDYVSIPLQFLFTDWHLGIRDCYMSPEQWAHWNFACNLTLSLLMTAVLLGGILLTLKAAAHEMKVSEMKTDFVSNVSHELRTPLSSIRVFGEFLKWGRVKDPEKIREYGEYIETESQRLTQLINNILDFSKIESGRKTYRYAKADVEATVAETLKMYEVRLRQDGFDIVFETPPRPLPLALIDREAIAQAFMNLLDNAVKYSGIAKRIFVKLEQREGQIDLSVTDNGIGIPQSDQDKIFEKFYRVSTGMVHDVKGSGLGLSIVKHIVEAHHGSITVNSQPSQGSTFTIHLPFENE